jgi:hypothetical protein
VDRPFPWAKRGGKDGKLLPFVSFIGHKCVGSGATLEVRWRDENLQPTFEKLQILQLYALRECTLYIKEHGLEATPGFIQVGKTKIERGSMEISHGRNITRCNNVANQERKSIRSTRQVDYFTSKATLPILGAPGKLLDPIKHGNPVRLIVSALAEENPEIHLETQDAKFLFSSTSSFLQQGAPGCGKCRGGGCQRCYMEYMKTEIKTCFLKQDIADDSYHCKVVHMCAVNSFLAGLSVLKMNDSGLQKKYPLLECHEKEDGGLVGEPLAIALRSLDDDKQDYLRGSSPSIYGLLHYQG